MALPSAAIRLPSCLAAVTEHQGPSAEGLIRENDVFRTTIRRALVLGLIGVIASVGIVAATPGVGAVGTILSTGTLSAGVRIHTADLKFSTRDDIKVVTQTITIAPGGSTGWHSHPGPVIVTISAGRMTFYDGDDPSCSPGTYRTGDSFVDRGGGHVHIARNEGSVDLVLFATYLVPIGAPIRTDLASPGNCPF
jgi:quercetin dioxygenase-like cupin family protein